MHDKIRKHIDNHIETSQFLLTQIPQIHKIASRLMDVLKDGGTIYWIGNGGSASDCEHLSAELCGNYGPGSKTYRSVALTSTPAITAMANDIGYDVIFSRQLKALCTEKDAVVALSTSGKSNNIEMGLFVATKQLAMTVGLYGNDGGGCLDLTDYPLVIPSTDTARIQECQLLIGHIICDLIHDQLQQHTHKSKAL